MYQETLLHGLMDSCLPNLIDKRLAAWAGFFNARRLGGAGARQLLDVSLPVIDKNHTAKYLVIDGLRYVRKALRALLTNETSKSPTPLRMSMMKSRKGTIAPRILGWKTERSEKEITEGRRILEDPQLVYSQSSSSLCSATLSFFFSSFGLPGALLVAPLIRS